MEDKEVGLSEFGGSEGGPSREELFKFLPVAQDIRKYHHNALWEEEKHFTWWISILISVMIFVYASKQMDGLSKGFILMFGSFFGMVLSYFGLRCIRKEGRYFREALETVNRLYDRLGLIQDERSPLVPKEYTPHQDFAAVRNSANKPLWKLPGMVILSLKKDDVMGIRDYFQLVFLMACVLFIAGLIWGVVIALKC
ncbi:MAG: hypothetical protein HYY17_03690 [Planctomycetes bacterium]|nr:hypothetical protein [Planctomycetota bacterium]